MIQTMNYYLHIPFCVKKCPYCDFYSETKLSNDIFEEYFNCLLNELSAAQNEELITSATRAKTIYFGGGTPSLFPIDYLSKVIKKLKPASDCETTLEVNPESGKKVNFEDYKAAGINRISLGIQSRSEKILKVLGRSHSNKDLDLTLEKIFRAGYIKENLSFDFIIGNPGETRKELKENLKFLEKHNPAHVSAYLLTIYDDTPFAKQVENQKLQLLTDDQQLNLYHFFQNGLTKLGYQRYEISNYAKENKVSRHNSNIWNFQDYLGLGAGAHSYFGLNRWYNKELPDYLKQYKQAQKKLAAIKSPLAPENYQSEFIMLAFRQVKGVDLEDFRKRFKIDFLKVYSTQIVKFMKAGLVEKKNSNIRLTPRGFDLYNLVVSEFM